MKEKDWFKLKKYPHIGLPLKIGDRNWVYNYISNPQNIQKHAFFPFIHKTIKTRKFRKKYDDNGNVRFNGKRVEQNPKIRHIFYANHLDANILSYYSQLLQNEYEKILNSKKLSRVVTGYRRIPLISTNSNNIRNMCNVDFANEVFDFIRNSKENILVSFTFDISNFFDNLDHKLIKQSWCNLLNTDFLPPDHYNIYRNITKFSFIEIYDIFEEFKDEIITETKSKSQKYKKVDKLKYLKNQNAIAFCDKDQFDQRIRKKGLIKNNKRDENNNLRTKGIPQGSPISSILANSYLFEFDKKINDEVIRCNGIYRRYSDDIIMICSIEHAKNLKSLIENEIKKYKLEIQPSKTQEFHFKRNSIHKCLYRTDSGNLITKRRLQYLGFEFDGEHTYLKSSSLAKFYRLMKRSLYRHAYYAKYTKNQEHLGVLYKTQIYNKYSYIGSNRKRIYQREKHNPHKWYRTQKFDWGNYITYAKLASTIMTKNKISGQIKRHWKILNNQIKIHENRIEKFLSEKEKKTTNI